MGIASDIVTSFVEPLQTTMTTTATALAGALSGPLKVGVTLYIIMFGILILYGYVRAPLSDFVINVIKISIIVALSTTYTSYNFYIQQLFFVHLPDGLGSIIAGGGEGSGSIESGAAFDSLIDRVLALVENIRGKASWRDWYPIIISAVVGVASTIAIFILFVVAMFAKVALALTLMIGPIFVACYLFRPTQSLFNSWIGVCLNFVTLQVLITALSVMLISLVSTFVEKTDGASGGEQLVMGIQLIGVFVFTAYLATSLPQMAGQISGNSIALGSSLLHSAQSQANKVGGKIASKVYGGAKSLAMGAVSAVRGGNTVKQG